jgi:non-heme chloroperoxidase
MTRKKKILLNILISLLISVVIYFGIASVMIAVGKPNKSTVDQQNLNFKELYIDYSSLPELQSFNARDGKELYYRYYPAQSNNTVILIHGSGWHSQYFLPLAEFISSENLAQVYTPDLRGHGTNPDRRGDVDYIEQLDDDLADFVAVIKEKNPKTFIIMGGHSSGGGLAIRFAGSKYGDQVNAYLLLSPFLKYNAPTVRPNSGGWAVPYTGRIAGLTMLNNVGISWFNYLTVIEFNMPEEARDGTETLSYSFRMNTAYAPRNYKKDLSAIYQPVLVVAGTEDESFYADQFGPVISQYTEARIELLEGVTHMGVVIGEEIHPVVWEWLKGLN